MIRNDKRHDPFFPCCFLMDALFPRTHYRILLVLHWFFFFLFQKLVPGSWMQSAHFIKLLRPKLETILGELVLGNIGTGPESWTRSILIYCCLLIRISFYLKKLKRCRQRGVFTLKCRPTLSFLRHLLYIFLYAGSASLRCTTL